jgi:predicted transcriptional regulator
MKIDWKIISYILSSKKRQNVIKMLAKGPLSLKQITLNLKTKPSNLSATIQGLEEKEIIQNMVPGVRKGKIFSLTKFGVCIMKEIHMVTRKK